MIQMRHVSFTYPGAKQKSLDDINLFIREGECVLITGQSGCGKSTLTRIMNGLCPKFYGGLLEGEYGLRGKSIENICLDEIGWILGSVFQDPRSQFFAKRVRDEIVLAMENHCIPREKMHARLKEVSSLLGIVNLHDREMKNLSSGEKQKVAIASVCALQPKGLVLDEPSANLDTNATAQLSIFLSKLKSQGHTLIVSEHRLHYLKDIFDRLVILDGGKIAAEYSRSEALALSNEELSSMGLRLFDVPDFEAEKRVGDYSDCPLKTKKITLRLNDIQILQDVDFGVRAGEVTAVTGSNGAGKTSLCRIMTGIQKETNGMVYINDYPTKRKIRTKNSFFVQQDVDYQLYTPSVEAEILMASAVQKEHVMFKEITKMLGLDELLKRHPNTLSGGQKQRVLIATAVLRDAPIMVLDEPTSGLDGCHMRAVSEILRKIASGGKSVLLVTHDLEFIRFVADTLAYMHMTEVKYHNKMKVQHQNNHPAGFIMDSLN